MSVWPGFTSDVQPDPCRHSWADSARGRLLASAEPLRAKYVQAVGQRRSPGLVRTARPSGSARVGSRCGQPWWSAIADLASSSRSQVAIRTACVAARLTWEAPSVNVRWRPSLAMAIVTHLVTRPVSVTGGSGPVDLPIFRRLCTSRRVRHRLPERAMPQIGSLGVHRHRHVSRAVVSRR